jgi:hypothetical protein
MRKQGRTSALPRLSLFGASLEEGWIIDVSRRSTVESCRIERRQGGAGLQSLNQVRVGNERAPKGEQIGLAVGKPGGGKFEVVAIRKHRQRPAIDLSTPLGTTRITKIPIQRRYKGRVRCGSFKLPPRSPALSRAGPRSSRACTGRPSAPKAVRSKSEQFDPKGAQCFDRRCDIVNCLLDPVAR